MKLFGFGVILLAALAVGSLFGINMGASDSVVANVPVQVPAVDVSVAEPLVVVAPEAAPSMVGVVGVLQEVASDQLVVQTNEGMVFMSINGLAGAQGAETALDQLRVGDKLAVWTQDVEGQLIVRKVVVVPQSPERMHYLGLVVNVTADRVDVVGQQGETTSFRTDSTVDWMPDASRAPRIGDTVTIVAKPDPLGDGWLAIAIVAR